MFVFVALTSCAPSAAETLSSPQGVVYNVDRVRSVTAEKLPLNSDFKMADRDLAKYAQTACALDVPPSTAPRRCDIYVQSDTSGMLIGYAAVTESKSGVAFDTFTTLNLQKQPYGESCYVGGKIYGVGGNYEKPVLNASRDFEGQVTYSAWEKNPGDFLISQVLPDESDANSDGALGVWYVHKIGDKLRMEQERWKYCYRNNKAYIDEVFFLVLTLTRADQ